MNAKQKSLIAGYKAAKREHNTRLASFYANYYHYHFPGRSIQGDSRASAISAWKQAA
jgi:hypothetical protein